MILKEKNEGRTSNFYPTPLPFHKDNLKLHDFNKGSESTIHPIRLFNEPFD